MPHTLVIGGTGVMGSRVVRRLAADRDATVAVFTRDPGSDRAAALLDQGGGRVRAVRGDLDDPASVHAAMAGVEQVFCNTDFFATASVLGELRQGVLALESARAAGVERFVWSSLDGAATLTAGAVPVPHFDSKAAVAAHINTHRAEELMGEETDGWYTEHVSILTTSPYFENLTDRLAPQAATLPDGREGLLFTLPLGDTGRYPLIGLDDIAWFADHMLREWQGWGARDLAVSAAGLTGTEIAATFEDVTGIPSAYQELPLDVLRARLPGVGHDYAAMARFIQRRDVVALDRDTDLLRRLHPQMMTFDGWLRRTGWTG